MTAPVHSANANAIDAHHPPDMPYALGGSPTVPHLLPPDVERDVEDSLRIASRHALQMERYDKAMEDAKIAILSQTAWLVCGCFLARRGYRFADPLQSFLKPYTENLMINKATNAVTILGGLMAGVTMWQLPTDVSFYRRASQAFAEEDAKKNAVIAARNAKLAQYNIFPQKKTE